MWIRDEDFIRGDIPMSKFEVRALVMASMDIKPGDRFLDIGAGTGSISVQAAKLGAEVSSIEREPEGIELIRKNAQKHGVKIETVEGEAPGIMPEREYDKIFIGGSGRKMPEIIDEAFKRLSGGGMIYATFITLKNLQLFQEGLKRNSADDIRTTLIQASRVKTKAEMLIAENPIFIIGGMKNG